MTDKVKLLDKVHLQFDEIEVYHNFDLEIPKNKITCIVGPSGCGKTSILNLLAGFITTYTGKIHIENERIGYIFQEDRLLPWETVFQNIAFVREKVDEVEIMKLLRILELEEFKDKKPASLSGGMRQRCAIARGFYYHSSLLLMDEPFKSLDYDLRLNLVKYLGTLWKEQENTIIFVTHDIDEALLLGHQVVVLSRRPTKILETITIKSDIAKRDINQQEHLLIRDKIIQHMTYYDNKS